MSLQKRLFSYLPLLLILALSGIGAPVLSAQTLTSDTPSVKSNTYPVRKFASVKGGLDKQIDYSWTDSILFNVKKSKVYLWGDAKLDYGTIKLAADYIEIDLNKKEIFAKGKTDSAGKYIKRPVLKDGEEELTSDSMRYNATTKKGRVYSLDLKKDEMIVKLSTVLKLEDGSMAGKSGIITTCNAPVPHFGFNTRQTKFIPGKKVVFGPAQLVVEGIPTPLAVPFGLAPIKKERANGLLFPSYGFRQGNKTFYLQNLGYYTGLGQYADLRLYSDLYLNGDFRLQAATVFVKKYKYSGNFSASYLQMSPTNYEMTRPSFKRSNSMSFVGQFDVDKKLLPGTTLGGNFNIQLGDYSRKSTIDVGTSSQTVFTSSINYARNFAKNKINLSASARHSQNLVTRKFDVSLPELNLGVPSITPFRSKKSTGSKWYEQFRINYNMNLQNKLSTYDTLLMNKKTRDSVLRNGIQNGFTHTLNANTNFKLFGGKLNITPSAAYNEVWFFAARYKEYNSLLVDNEQKLENDFYRFNKYNFTLNANTQIYGTFQNLKWGKIAALRHTITPSIGFNYSPEIKLADKYKINYQETLKRSDGTAYDTIIKKSKFESSFLRPYEQAENGSISLSIRQNLQGKKADGRDSSGKVTKGEKVNLIDQFTVGTSYNLLAKQFKLGNITAGFATVLLKKININADGYFDPYAVDSNYQRINKFLWKEKQKPVRFSYLYFNLNTRLTPDDFKAKKDRKPKATDNPDLQARYSKQAQYLDFNIPWSLTLNYGFSYDYTQFKRTDKFLNTHNLTFSGDISITQDWKITYQNTLDLKTGLLSAGGYGVSRNLHCWQIDFNWTPVGYSKGWVFSLRPKSGLLQDLKLNKRITNLPFF